MKPLLVLVVSAHWEEAVPTVQSHPQPPVLYDNEGFPPTFQLSLTDDLDPARAPDRMGELAMPVLSVHGEDDQAIAIELADALQAQVADGRGGVRVPGAAHAPTMTHPEIVNPGIAAFLDSL